MPDQVRPGLYQQIVDESLESKLRELVTDKSFKVKRRELAASEAGDRLALHLSQIIRRTIDGLSDADRVRQALTLARDLVERLTAYTNDPEAMKDAPVLEASVLSAILGRSPDSTYQEIEEPLTPLLDTTLLTNSPGEPRVLRQIQAEIPSAEGIDLVMAFIRRSGVRPLRRALEDHCGKGRRLRVLTTTFTGSTEAEALDELQRIGADVRVSYDTSCTRLHAKSWLFERPNGYSTAYVGSSNLTQHGQASGMEWNVRLSEARNPDAVQKITAVFESYWQNPDFEPFNRDEFEARTREGLAEPRSTHLPPTELRLEPFQRRLLEMIDVAREAGQHRNLLVAATGTGKTVMAAVDYRQLRTRLDRARLLFVAHREEILEQSLSTFRYALRDPSFGELWVGGRRPKEWNFVFASIQSLAASGYQDLQADHFDVVIVDEFHHAAARTYEGLLSHVQPRELLGLTATPERADGRTILDRFGGRLAAELRLWDAIEQRYLVPFIYYGIHDGSDLRSVPWTRGRGYDVDGLTNVLTQDDRIASLVCQQLLDRVDDASTMRVLGFCVSVEHARFMARVFNELGVPSVAVWGETADAERKGALADLRDGRVKVVFSVDLFNEGVDVPRVDTLLLMRPTESATLFLQQLGRGLRRSDGKQSCLVLDFVGHHRAEFRFDVRLRALLGGTRREVERQVQNGFPLLPAGCHMELEAQAQDAVLASLRNALPSTRRQKAEELSKVSANRGTRVGLGEFLSESGLELEDIYTSKWGWSDLLEAAGLPTAAEGPNEAALRRACGRLLHVDDPERIGAYLELCSAQEPPTLPQDVSSSGVRFARMLTSQLLYKQVPKETTLADGLALLWRHPQVLAEICELMRALRGRVQHLHSPLEEYSSVPLRVHARYTRLEILSAFGSTDRATQIAWQTGVMFLKDPQVDLLAFTLDKSAGSFSPTTRYRDYAISETLIHWESQSQTRAASQTGMRYQQHASRGSAVMLFARERTDERAFWFLGPARYVSHERERPMAITWRLEHPLPGDLFAALAAAVA